MQTNASSGESDLLSHTWIMTTRNGGGVIIRSNYKNILFACPVRTWSNIEVNVLMSRFLRLSFQDDQLI